MVVRILVLPTLLALLLVSACGSDAEESAPEPSRTEHNEADVRFATRMIPHHAEAVSMVDLTLGRDLDPDLVELAEGIRTTQVAETETMVDWLTDWGEEVPETMRDHVNSHAGDHGGTGDEDLAALEQATGADFERMFLEMMIEHHEGAVEMAETELDEGRYLPARELAEEITKVQQSEIDRMRELLG
jgi:uncharacterized protein (DUF305 family)